MSLLKNTGPTTLTQTWYVNGTPTDVGVVTIGIVDEAGTVVVTPGTATTNNTDGTYEYALAVQTEVTWLTVTWTDTASQSLVSRVEVRGNHLYTEAAARAYYGSEFTSETTYPDSKIAAARDRTMDEFQQICGVSFVERHAREQLTGLGGRALEVKYPKVTSVISATVNSVAVTASNVLVVPQDSRTLWRTDGNWTRGTNTDPLNVTVEYAHGYTSVPGDIQRAALILLRHFLVADTTGGGLSDRTVSLTDDVGTIRLATADGGRGRWYGIPFVDTTLMRYNHQVPVS